MLMFVYIALWCPFSALVKHFLGHCRPPIVPTLLKGSTLEVKYGVFHTHYYNDFIKITEDVRHQIKRFASRNEKFLVLNERSSLCE